MRIKTSGQALYLYRYGGFDKVSKRTLEVKIGSLPLETLPLVGTDLDLSLVDQNISLDLWEALTVNEQRELIEHLKQRHALRFRERLSALSIDLAFGANAIKPELMDKELADSLRRGMSALSASLKKAGHGKAGVKCTALLSNKATASVEDPAPQTSSVSSNGCP